jgi:hypothetical protein
MHVSIEIKTLESQSHIVGLNLTVLVRIQKVINFREDGDKVLFFQLVYAELFSR